MLTRITDEEIKPILTRAYKIGSHGKEYDVQSIAEMSAAAQLAQDKEDCKKCEYDPQAEQFGWAIEKGWTPPGELERKLEQERRDIGGWLKKQRVYKQRFDIDDGAVESFCQGTLPEGVKTKEVK